MREAAPVDVRLSLFGGRSFHLDGHDGLIVKGLDSVGVVRNSGEDGVYQIFGAAVRAIADNLVQALAPEQITLGTCGIENSVAEKEEHVARMPAQVELVIGRIVEQADRQTGRPDRFGLSIVAVNRARQSGICDLQQSLVVVPDGVNHGDVLPSIGRSESDRLMASSMPAALGSSLAWERAMPLTRAA